MDPAYTRLAQRLDEFPNGYPPTPEGTELRILAKLFTPQEADLASRLKMTLETAAEIAARSGGDPVTLRPMLKSMARRGLIRVGATGKDLGFGLLPFVVGIYEEQNGTIDEELARLFEEYYLQGFGKMLAMDPPVHRVIPIGASVRASIEIHPFESAAEIVNGAKAWGVLDCICRKQKALIGQGCSHPLDVCLALSMVPGAFDRMSTIRALSQDEAMDTLRRAAQAGLVHSVSNSQEGVSYICNCCTCACGILRGMADLGLANVIARSAFLNQVDSEACQGCELCIDECAFSALSMAGTLAQVDAARCVGCGVCVSSCPDGALGLMRRPEEDILTPPLTPEAWRTARASVRGKSFEGLL